MGNDVEGEGMGENGVSRLLPGKHVPCFGEKFIHPFCPGAGRRLVGGHDDGLEPEVLADNLKGNDGDGCRAVGTRDEKAFPDRIAVDLRDDEGYLRVVPEGRGIVYDISPRGDGLGSELRRPSAADREKTDLSLIHISEPTRLGMISYAVFCLK